MKGGGAKGAGYVGALLRLSGMDERGKKIEGEEDWLSEVQRVAGASAGAIVACLMSVGYTPMDIIAEMRETEFGTFRDSNWGLIRNTWRMLHKWGWCKGEAFERWLDGLVFKATKIPNITFRELHELVEKKGHDDKDGVKRTAKDLYVVTTNVSRSCVFTFCHDLENADRYPFSLADTPIVKAVRMSMSIPGFFVPVEYEGEVFADGGILWNNPLELFDTTTYCKEAEQIPQEYQVGNSGTRMSNPENAVFNWRTLGMWLGSQDDLRYQMGVELPPAAKVWWPFAYQNRVFASLLAAQEAPSMLGVNRQRLVYINTVGIGTTDFDLSQQQQDDLLLSGRQGAEAYLQWIANPSTSRAAYYTPIDY